MDEQKIRKIATDVFNQLLKKSQYDVGPTPYHTHDGVNSPLLENSGGGGGTPSGSSGDVQFNDSGAFGGSSNLTYDDSVADLYVGQIGSNGSLLTLHAGLIDDTAIESNGPLNITVKDRTISGGEIVIQASNALTNTNAGANVGIYAGAGKTSGNGGDIHISAGNRDTTGHRGDIILNDSTSVPTTSNGGFLVIPFCFGAPTGSPNSAGSLIYDLTNNKLYVYSGSAWKSVALT